MPITYSHSFETAMEIFDYISIEEYAGDFREGLTKMASFYRTGITVLWGGFPNKYDFCASSQPKIKYLRRGRYRAN